jgi:hypothetical protein
MMLHDLVYIFENLGWSVENKLTRV